MSELVTRERRGRLELITIDHPPVNALSQPVREALEKAIVSADRDSAVKAIVLHGSGKQFIAGADIREFEKAPLQPLLNDLLLRIEACGKPVIAALHGMALGGGLETALASHYRCATPDTRVGLPEIKLALLPGSGGTQRLPRVVGVATALDMMISGDLISLARAQSLGLIDEVVESLDDALRYADELVSAGARPRRLRERPIPGSEAATADFFAGYRKSLSRSARASGAAERIIKCVEAAVSMPFDEALALSRTLFEECRVSSQSAALRHLFFAERGSRVPALQTARAVERICVVGAGTMGAGIAISCATGGFNVTLVDTQQSSLENGLARVRSTLDAAVTKGRMTSQESESAQARVQSANDLGAASDAQLVIEAVFESMALKRDVFAKLDEVCRPGALLATNTSTLDVDAIAAATRRAPDVLGMHFFSPANIMRAVEVVRGKATSNEAMATALAVAKRMGKLGVVVGNCFGFVGNRMLYAYGRENQQMLLEGATPHAVDSALEDWGMAMGPNAVADLAGLDVGYRVRQEHQLHRDDPHYYRVADLLVERGRLGQKVGKGYYLYDAATRARQVDPDVEALIREEARQLGVKQRNFDASEIVERCIGALIIEGTHILEEGVASSADDIDVIWCNGYGFPRTRGGPMFYGKTQLPHRR